MKGNTSIKLLDLDSGEVKSYSMKPYLTIMDKYEVARQMVLASVVKDEDVGLIVDSVYCEVFEFMELLKGYTDYDVPEEIEKQIALYDYCKVNYVSLCDDAYSTQGIANRLRENLKKNYEIKNSLSNRLLKMFGNIITDEPLEETLGKATEIQQFLIGLMEKANKGDAMNNPMLNIGKKKT